MPAGARPALIQQRQALWSSGHEGEPRAKAPRVAPSSCGVRRSRSRSPHPHRERPSIYSAELDSIIHPASAEYMIQTLERADAEGASLVVFTLRTPGGLVDSMRDIVSRMIAAKTPVAIFVAPSGSRAASAGFVLTIAADVAAMAPGTHIGAAHPVAGGGAPMDETTSKKAAETCRLRADARRQAPSERGPGGGRRHPEPGY